MSHSQTIGLILEPLDVLFFRDGRPFGESTRASGSTPLPQTLAGALRTALLRYYHCDFERLMQCRKETPDDRSDEVKRWGDWFERSGAPGWIAHIAVRGPWLAMIPTAGTTSPTTEIPCEVLVPAPATLQQRKKDQHGELRTLRPLVDGEVPGWRDTPQGQAGLRPLWSRGRDASEPARGFLTSAGLRAFLHGEAVDRHQLIKWDGLLDHDHRTGIAVDPDRLTAEKSMIYGASFLALKRATRIGSRPDLVDIAFYAEASVPADGVRALSDLKTLAWGGESRHVRARVAAPFTWPTAEGSGKGRAMLLLTTPGLCLTPACPTVLNGHVVSAAIPGAVAVSGWDLARGGPKPNRFAAAAGSVYYLRKLPPDLPSSLNDNPFDGHQGWGCFLKGTWNHG